MSQGFDAGKPAFLDPLTSDPMRVNFTALATHHAGPQAPANPANGWIWMDTSDPVNIQLKAFINNAWITILSNIQAGAPSQSNVDKFVHTQATVATQWDITHSLDTEDILFTVYDSNGLWMMPNDFEILDPNTVRITFLSQESGKCVITG